jgi:signal transduction histidine kinase
VPPSLPPLLADRAHFRQVLHELLGNAIDALPTGGRITIAARVVDDGRRMVRLSIADNGAGVPPDMRDRLFQLFTTNKAGGTGVGLAVARKIIERHGGSIELAATAEPGACFVLTMPIAPV